MELRGLDGDAYADARETEADQVQRLLKQDADAALKSPISNQQSALAAHAQERLRGRNPFHWLVEFPEVFARGGFDAFVGNPPYMGGTKVSSSMGQDYLYFLVSELPKSSGNSDFVTFFVGRSAKLLTTRGLLGLVTTGAILAGDSYRAAVEGLLESGFELTRELVREPWPGQGATVAYVALLMKRFSLESKASDRPYALKSNDGLCNRGSDVFGEGFILSEEEVAEWKKAKSKSLEVVMPYLGGAEFNNDPSISPNRYIINFGEFTEAEAKQFEDAYERVERLVKPARKSVQQRDRRELWWLFATRAPAVVKFLATHRRCIAIAQLPRHLAFAFVPPGIVFSNTVLLFLFDSAGAFAALQSFIHAAWVYRWSGAMGTSTRYTSTECFETFPFPTDLAAIAKQGENYHSHRTTVMQTRQEGLTKTYNRFHDRGEASADIARLRALHVELDQAVAAAYGWHDLDLGHGFHPTKQGERYTLSEPARRTVLDRLLALNHQRYAEEVKAGLHNKKNPKGKNSKPKATGGTPQPDLLPPPQPDLL